MQLPLWLMPRLSCTLFRDFRCEQWTRSITPEPGRFVADVNPALVKQIFHVAERKWEANVHHHRKANDLG